MLTEEVKKLKSFWERRVSLTAELKQLETDTANQMAMLRTQLLARLRLASDTDTPLYLWFRYRGDLDSLVEYGHWKSEVYFEADGKTTNENRISGWFLHRTEAVAAFESLKELWGEAVTVGEAELGGNDLTSYMKVDLILQ
ncbi:MAG: hypothetical protein AAB837_03010 [Patescibacteria group bacterium]